MVPRRLKSLTHVRLLGDLTVFVASGPLARLLGVALLRELPLAYGLLLPRCRSVHTFGMRFALDLVWMDYGGRVVAVTPGVPPGRFAWCRQAARVIEVRAGEGPRFARAWQDSAAMDDLTHARPVSTGGSGARMRAALDPRQRIERDSFNELFVFVLSASGAAVIAPVLLLIVFAFADKPGVLPFVGLAVLVELVLIFGIGRPQMKPAERVGWALLWSLATAVLAVCFYYLVLDPLL